MTTLSWLVANENAIFALSAVRDLAFSRWSYCSSLLLLEELALLVELDDRV